MTRGTRASAFAARAWACRTLARDVLARTWAERRKDRIVALSKIMSRTHQPTRRGRDELDA